MFVFQRTAQNGELISGFVDKCFCEERNDRPTCSPAVGKFECYAIYPVFTKYALDDSLQVLWRQCFTLVLIKPPAAPLPQRSTFDAAVAAAVMGSSPNDSISSVRSAQGNNYHPPGRVSLGVSLGLGSGAAAAATANAGKSNRRLTTGPGSSLRGLLHRFDATRSPRDSSVTPRAAMAAAAASDNNPSSGRGSRWTVGGVRKKRGLGSGGGSGGSGARSPINGGGGGTSAATSRQTSISSNTLSPGSRGMMVLGARSGSVYEVGSPVRQRPMGNVSAFLSASLGRTPSIGGGSENGGSWRKMCGTQRDEEEGAVAVGSGEFLGGGHALCRSRARCVLPLCLRCLGGR